MPSGVGSPHGFGVLMEPAVLGSRKRLSELRLKSLACSCMTSTVRMSVVRHRAKYTTLLMSSGMLDVVL